MTDEEIKRWLEDVLKNMPISFTEIKILTPNEGMTIFAIETPESGLLIGNNGETLYALNHLLRRATENKTKTPQERGKSISIDVNDYRKRNEERIKGIAAMLGERVLGLKHEVIMEPMGSYERRVVHALFQEHPHLLTESRGFGKGRHIIIKYAEHKNNNAPLKESNEEESF